MKAWSLVFVLCFAASCFADDPSIGFGAGVNKPIGHTWYTVDWRFKLWGNLSVQPQAGFWEDTNQDHRCVFGTCLSERFYQRDFDTGINVLYSLSQNRVTLSFGGGPAAHFLRSETERNFTGLLNRHDLEEDSRTEAALNILAEADFKLSDTFSLMGATRCEVIHKTTDGFKLYAGIRMGF